MPLLCAAVRAVVPQLRCGLPAHRLPEAGAYVGGGGAGEGVGGAGGRDVGVGCVRCVVDVWLYVLGELRLEDVFAWSGARGESLRAELGSEVGGAG